MDRSSPTRERLDEPPSLAVTLGVWLLVAAAATNALYLNARATGAPASWGTLFLSTLPVWLVWAAMTPLLFRLEARVPLALAPRSLLIHAATSVVWMAAYSAFVLALVAIHRGLPLRTVVDAPATLLKPSDLYLDYFGYWLVLGVAKSLRGQREARRREAEAADLLVRNAELETRLATAQLDTLRAQLDPHFLFNTLNSVAALVRKGEDRAALRMLSGLGDLLRQGLGRERAQLVSLEEEMALVGTYLEIERVRFADRVRVELDISPAALDVSVPSLLLQPLVENAFRHGIARAPGPGLVRVSAACDNGRLRIRIYNDGPRLPDAWREEEAAGIGLANTRERLSRLYGSDFRLELRNAAPGGVEVDVSIPLGARG